MSLTLDERVKVIRAMQQHGGSFVRKLADAWWIADDDYSLRLEIAFPDLVARYRQVAALTQGERI